MIVRTPTLGLEPVTASALISVGGDLLSALFRPASSGPSQAEIAMALEAQRRADQARTRTWLIAGGIAAAGLVAYLAISRRS